MSYIFPPRDRLAETVRYLEQEPSRTPADAIEAVWVASDDATMMGEARTVAGEYSTRLHCEDIVYVIGRVPGVPQVSEVITHSDVKVLIHGALEAVAPLRITIRYHLRSPADHSCLVSTKASDGLRIRCIITL